MGRINNDAAPEVYVVGWPRENVVKVGYTAFRRWKPFVARGGIVIRLEPYAIGPEAIERETYLQGLMDEVFERAYTEKAQAQEILGHGGAGYLECYIASIENAQAVLDGR